MNTACSLYPPPLVPVAWHQALKNCCFEPSGDAYRLNGMVARAAGDWLVLESDALVQLTGQKPAELERRGLWKQVGCERPQRFLFEFPALAISPGGEDDGLDDSGSALPQAFLEWALASARNEIPVGWQPPAKELVASWIPQGGLTVRVGPLVRQGELLLTPERWTLRFSILPCLPAELPKERRLALELLAVDAQAQWRMLRAGLCETADGTAMVAALDLTGAPHSQLLFLAGLDGLTHAVAWLVETADLLADVTVALRALDVCRSQNDRKERKRYEHRHH